MLVVVIILASVPDAVRASKPLMMLLVIATSAPSDIPVLYKLMIGVLANFISFIVLDLKAS